MGTRRDKILKSDTQEFFEQRKTVSYGGLFFFCLLSRRLQRGIFYCSSTKQRGISIFESSSGVETAVCLFIFYVLLYTYLFVFRLLSCCFSQRITTRGSSLNIPPPPPPPRLSPPCNKTVLTTNAAVLSNGGRFTSALRLLEKRARRELL